MSIVRDAARWIFLAALIYAPWAYGGTTSTSIQIINWLLLLAFILWIVELLVRWRRPRFPRLLLFLTCALITIGGWMALNAISIYDSDFYVFVPLRNFASHLTGSVDYAISAAWMLRGALLLCAILFVVDVSQSSRWLLRLWYTIGLAGGTIAFVGLLQKATGAQMIFWQTAPVWGAKTFFFCDLLLSRKCWSIFELGLAVNRRSRRTRFYETLPSRNAGIVGERAYSDSCRSSRQHIANGSTDRAFVVNRPLRTTWTGASAKSFARRKKYRPRRCDRDSLDSVRAWTGDPS